MPIIAKKPKAPVEPYEWFLGIDSSTKTGVAAVVPTAPMKFRYAEAFVIKEPDMTGFPRSMKIAARVGSLIDRMGCLPMLALIEGYAFANANSLGTLVEVGTCIRYRMFVRSVNLCSVSPNSLKMFVAGSGNCGYNEFVLAAFKRFGIEDTSDDVIDAKCLGIMAAYFANGWSMTGPQMKAQATVSKIY